jgi:hypothetical protein
VRGGHAICEIGAVFRAMAAKDVRQFRHGVFPVDQRSFMSSFMDRKAASVVLAVR